MAGDEPDDLFAGVPAPKPLSRIKQRLIRAVVEIDGDPDSILFMHTIFCQAGLPYRDPGADTRVWERLNGKAHLEMLAGKAMHPEKGRLVELGLPFGPKPRLILAHLNAEALRTASPEIEVEASLTAFVKRLKLDPKGRNMRIIKDQLARLSASSIRLGLLRDGRAITVNSQIVTAFDLWFPKDDRQRVLWPSTVRLSLDYFESLPRHAVPLDERALVALAHSAMALDVYCLAGAAAAPDRAWQAQLRPMGRAAGSVRLALQHGAQVPAEFPRRSWSCVHPISRRQDRGWPARSHPSPQPAAGESPHGARRESLPAIGISRRDSRVIHGHFGTLDTATLVRLVAQKHGHFGTQTYSKNPIVFPVVGAARRG